MAMLERVASLLVYKDTTSYLDHESKNTHVFLGWIFQVPRVSLYDVFERLSGE